MDEGSQYSIHSICRICLELLRNENAYDLFMIPGLAKKLCVCTSLSVEAQDGFPKNICGVCYTRLNDLHDFQKLCVDSVQKFQEMVASNAFDTPPMTAFDLLETRIMPDSVEYPTGGDDEDRINFDPLLNHKMELIENEDDVFKMLETVDKEVEEAEQKLEQAEFMDCDPFEDKKMFDNESSPSSESEAGVGDEPAEEPAEFQSEVSDSEDDKPLALRLRQSRRRVAKQARAAVALMDKAATGATGGGADDDEEADDDDDDDYEGNDDDDDEDDDDEDDDDEDADVMKKDKAKDPTAAKPKRKRIPAAERHLHRIIECHICHKKFKKPVRYEEHMKYHNDKLPHQCTVETCLKGFTTANGLRLHVEHCHAETVESIPCPEKGCGRVFPRSRLLNWHLRKVHKISKELMQPRAFPCNECDKVFRCPMALKKHMYKHDGKELPYPCNICGKRFVINSALRDHLMRHAGIKNYVCPYCGVGKTTRQEWNTHINTHTQEKKFKCTLCPHASHNKQNLRMHVKIVHDKIKDYACQYCGKTFGKSNACKMHEMTHTGEKRCECKVCGKRFLYNKGLTKHLKTHEKRVLRAIEVYRKRQVESGAISAEQAEVPLADSSNPEAGNTKESHQRVADEIMKVCAESAAAIPKDPRRVERVDITELAGTAVNPIPSVAVPSWSPQINFMMKEGPHICPDCGQGFNGSGNLKRHHRIVHEGVKDFACRYCPRRFAKAQTLKHHEMTHTGEKPHECTVCGKRFIQYVALKRHHKVHANRPPPAIPSSVYAAREELQMQERQKIDAKRKAEERKAAIAEAAKEQLQVMREQEEILKQQQQQELQRIFANPVLPKPKSGTATATSTITSAMAIATGADGDGIGLDMGGMSSGVNVVNAGAGVTTAADAGAPVGGVPDYSHLDSGGAMA